MLTSPKSKERIRNLSLHVSVCETTFQILESAHGVFQKSFPRHMHSFYELHYIYGGKGQLITDTASFPLRKGDLYIIPPHYDHEQLTDLTDRMEEFHVAFCPVPGSSPAAPVRELHDLGFHLMQVDPSLERIYDRIDEEVCVYDAYSESLLQTLFGELLIQSLRLLIPLDTHKEIPLSADEKRLLHIDQLFLQKYATITLPEMAKALNLSTNHVTRLIKQHYGKTFIEMRSLTRLNAAADLLGSTSLPISQISDQCGFSNPIYFTQEFKKEFHMTPRDYRKQH